MAGGPIFPFSALPVTAGRVFPTFLTTDYPEGLGFEASLGANSTWRLFYRMPVVLPTGTAKLLIVAQANATTGDIKLNPSWKSYGALEVPNPADLTGEGTQTISFATTAYRLTELKVTLDADTIVAGELVMMDFIGLTSGWTLTATLSVLLPPIIWE